jgi:amino acid transporter
MGKVHPKTRVPHVAVIANSCITMALALSGTFTKLVVLSTLAAAIVYFIGCIACLILRKRDVKSVGEPLKLRITPVIAVVGMLGMAAIVAQATRDEIIASVATIVFCLVYYKIVQRLGRAGTTVGARKLA